MFANAAVFLYGGGLNMQHCCFETKETTTNYVMIMASRACGARTHLFEYHAPHTHTLEHTFFFLSFSHIIFCLRKENMFNKTHFAEIFRNNYY